MVESKGQTSCVLQKPRVFDLSCDLRRTEAAGPAVASVTGKQKQIDRVGMDEKAREYLWHGRAGRDDLTC
jgi:hypothetical protein